MPLPKLAKNIAWNYLGYAYEAVVGVLILAYVVRIIEPAAYGILLISYSVGGLLWLLDLGLTSLLVQGYVAERAKNGTEGVGLLLTTSFLFLALLGLVSLLVTIILTTFLPWPFNVPAGMLGQASAVLLLTGLTIQLAFPTSAIEAAYESSARYDTLNKVQMVLATVRAGATILVVHAGYGIVGLACLQLAMAILRFWLLWSGLARNTGGVRFNLRARDWRLLGSFWRPGRWAMLDNAGRQLAMSTDTLILGIVGPMSSVAIYGVGSKLPLLMSAVIGRGINVTFPHLAEYHALLDQEGLRRVYLDTCRLVFTMTLPVVVLGISCSENIIRIAFGEQYLGSAPIMQWLLVAGLSLGMAMTAGTLLYARGWIRAAARITCIEGIVNLSLSVCLVIPYGGTGLAAATAITHSVATVFWFTPLACRAAGISPGSLARVLAKDAAFPTIGMIVTLLCFRLITFGSFSHLTLLAGTVAGLCYLLVWVRLTGLYIFRRRAVALG